MGSFVFLYGFVAQYLVGSLGTNLFINLLKVAKDMKISKKLNPLIHDTIQNLVFIFSWILHQTRNGDATRRIVQLIGQNHFIVKAINDVFTFPDFVNISIYLYIQNQRNRQQINSNSTKRILIAPIYQILQKILATNMNQI